MGVSAITQRVLRAPGLFGQRSLRENDRARKKLVPRRLLLRLGIRLLIILWLLGVLWVEPVISTRWM